jgi:tetratricopeptide (TPR) repeat protein
VALSWSKYVDGDSRGADREIQRALKLNPNCAQAHSFLCYYLSVQGRTEEAKQHSKRGQELVPSSRIQATVAGYPFVTARQYNQAITQFRKALDLDGNFALAHLWIVKCYEAQSKYPAALDEFATNDLLDGDDPAKVAQKYRSLREALANSGERGYWLKALEFQQADDGLVQRRRAGGRRSATHFARWWQCQAPIGC